MEVSIIRALVVLLCVSTVSCQSSVFVPCANPPSGSASTDQPPLPQLPNQFSVHIEANIVQVSIYGFFFSFQIVLLSAHEQALIY